MQDITFVAASGLAEDFGEQTWQAQGDLSLPKAPSVAVIGSRDVSPDGRKRARRLGRELAQAGFVLVSGLALGVDIEAMQAACDAGGRLIGVVATGLEVAYPPEHRDFQAMLGQQHLLLSARPSTRSRVGRQALLARNEIIASISDATVLVAAAERSGTRRGYRTSLRLGRPFFVLSSLYQDPPSWLDTTRVQELTRTEQLHELLSREIP